MHVRKLDLILNLARDCNSTLKRIESRGENQHISSVPSDDVREQEVIDEAEPEPEIVDEPVSEPDLKVVDKLDPKAEVEESLIETSVDLLAEPIIELLSSSPTMRFSYPLGCLTCTIHCRSF